MADIELKALNKFYGKVHVIKDFSLKIKDQSFTTLVGPSGCGKSTLLRMIAGLEEINSGSISIDGIKVNDLPPRDRGIAMVFQSYALYPHMTVFENMAFGLKIEKKSQEEISQRVHDAARILQIEELLERKPKQLSGGQRQRVAIGRAITRKPKVFLFDEPLSNLDAALRVQMRVELAKLHEHLNATMVYVTHDQTEAMTLSDEIVVLDEGEISQLGQPLDLYNKPRNMFVAGFIGSPKMNFIPAKLISNDENKTEIEFLGSKYKINQKLSQFSENQNITFGVRPENIHLSHDENFNWESKAFVVEKLGSSTFLYLESQNEPIVVECSGDNTIKAGENVRVNFDFEKISVFDKEGKSIL